MSAQIRPLLPNPGRLVTEGRFNLGTFKTPFESVNPLDAELGGRFRLPRALKNLRLKEWQHFALVNPDYYLSLALFNAKTLALAQVCVYSRRDGAIYFYERKVSPRKLVLPDTLRDSRAQYRGKGFEIDIQNLLDAGHHLVRFEIGATKKLPPVRGRFTCYEDPASAQPLVVALPLGRGRAMYSHKFICKLDGWLHIGDRDAPFKPAESYGLIDIHKGYYPYVMKWHWATGGFYDDAGKRVGFNLTDNQVSDQDAYNENGVWLHGRLSLLPPVRFHFDKGDLYQPWTIRDRHSMVDLTFKPEVIRTVNINILLLKSRYRAPFGTFSGRLRTVEGDEVEILNAFGMCEDFYLRT